MQHLHTMTATLCQQQHRTQWQQHSHHSDGNDIIYSDQHICMQHSHNNKQPIVATALHTVAATFTNFALSHCWYSLQLSFWYEQEF